tara:strand:+ start:184 stop:426 length:243 start_codon:yes stop_codon:yes gene_type:complete
MVNKYTCTVMKKKIKWDTLFKDMDSDVELVNPGTMEPGERYEFINGVYLDYQHFLSQRIEKGITARYKLVLVELIKTYGH